MTLVDTNVLIDIFTNDPAWADWSAKALIDCATEAAVGINPVIDAEVSVAFNTELGAVAHSERRPATGVVHQRLDENSIQGVGTNSMIFSSLTA